MTATNRRIISLLLSLILVISGSASAFSEVADDAAMTDCGSMMADLADTTGSASDDGASCVTSPDMACPTASGLNSCGVNVGLLPTGPSGLIGAGSQPVLSALEGDYQDPFLAFITPPPQFRS